MGQEVRHISQVPMNLKITLMKLRGESTSMKKLLHGSSKAVSERSLMIPQFISCKLPPPRVRGSPWPGGSCLHHRQPMQPSAAFQALGSKDLFLPWLLTSTPLPLLTRQETLA